MVGRRTDLESGGCIWQSKKRKTVSEEEGSQGTWEFIGPNQLLNYYTKTILSAPKVRSVNVSDPGEPFMNKVACCIQVYISV